MSQPTPAPISRSRIPAETPLWRDCLILWALAFCTGLCFLTEPGFGDELTYWGLAFGLHDAGRSAWSVHSFHDLRWPVWGVNWLWQSLFGAGLASFYCTPFLYLAAAATIVFAIGKKMLHSRVAAWSASIALLFAPVLDAVISRPMPDLSEGFFGAAALLAWWSMMKEPRVSRALLLGTLSGLCIGLAFANRATGIFIAPVLAVGSLLFFPRRFAWLAVPALAATLVFLAEGAVYQSVCGDWLHSIHANLGARGAKDVEPTTLWRLPFRLLPGFFRGNRLAPIYATLAGVGLWSGWMRWGKGGRMIVVWFVALYLEYGCAVQSLNPVRPLIGSTFRYLGALALPMSLVAALGTLEVWRGLRRIKLPRVQRFVREVTRRPTAVACVAIVALALYSSRPFFHLGFATAMASYMRTLPAGTRVFTHPAMRDLAFLVDAGAAQRLAWRAPHEVMLRNDEAEQAAEDADQFWYLSKQLWLRTRKKIEDRSILQQPEMGTYLESPQTRWILAQVLVKGGSPELVFYRRRPASAPPARVIEGNTFSPPLLPLPCSWSPPSPRNILHRAAVPAEMRGQLVNWEIEGNSTSPEPCEIRITFLPAENSSESLLLKPIFFPSGGRQSFVLPIPATATEFTTELRFHKNTNDLTITDLRAIYDESR